MAPATSGMVSLPYRNRFRVHGLGFKVGTLCNLRVQVPKYQISYPEGPYERSAWSDPDSIRGTLNVPRASATT